jgi:phospholipid transport system substrate-binding protein
MLLVKSKNSRTGIIVHEEDEKMKKKLMPIMTLWMILIFTLPVYAGVPLDAVKKSVNEILDVLRDPKLKPASATELKKEKLRVTYESMFDEIEFSKRTLTRHWNTFTPAQRTEFVNLFEQVLENSYADKILGYTNEKVEFYKENKLSDTQVEVQSKVITSSKEIPIFYRMILKDGKWKVYDVVIENVSLVQNYRTQFSDILAKDKPEKLLETLRKKLNKK